MTRRNYSIIIAAGLLICLALNLYNRFVLVPRTMVTFEIHPLSIFCRFVTSPLSWIFIGMILAALIFRDGRGVPGQKWDTVVTVIGVLLLIVFWVMVILLYSGISTTRTHQILAWLSSNPMAFLIPGIFIGIKPWNMAR